jgi:hypothetical protein
VARFQPIRRIVRRIIQRIIGRPAPPPTRYLWSYRCDWIDPNTGESVGSTFVSVVEESATNYQRASRDARQAANATTPEDRSPGHLPNRSLQLRCRRVGSIIGIP